MSASDLASRQDIEGIAGQLGEVRKSLVRARDYMRHVAGDVPRKPLPVPPKGKGAQ